MNYQKIVTYCLMSLAISTIPIFLDMGDVEGFCCRSGYKWLSAFDGFFYALHDRAAVLLIISTGLFLVSFGLLLSGDVAVRFFLRRMGLPNPSSSSPPASRR